MKNLKFLLLTLLLFPVLLFSQGTYYDGIDPTSPSFISDLQNVIRSPFTHISYDQYDETMITQFTAIDNGDGTHSVFCVYTNYEYVYTGTFTWLPMSREHTFCHSWMPTYPSQSGNEYSDQHMLFPVNQNNANSPRSNHPLGIVVNPTFTFMEGKLGTDANGNTVYEPRDEFKGNVARALFYAVLMYDGTGGSWAFDDVNAHLVNDLGEAPQDVNLLVSWHSNDPPDADEIARNDYVQSIQQNRNPFVDHPEWVSYIDFNTLTSGGTAAPLITNIVRSPKVPYENINTVITCDVTESGRAITTVELNYTINGGSLQTVTMTNTTGIAYMGEIPSSAYGNGDFVEYYIHAVSDAGGEANSITTGFLAGITPMTTLHLTDANAALIYDGVHAKAEGDATVENGTYSSSSLQVYFQDGVGGLNIYKGGNPATFQLGRVYEVTGQLAQYNGLAELVPDDVGIDIIDKGAGTTPDPLVLTIAQFLADPEAYEGMLVGIQHVTNDGSGDPWPSSGSNANLTISDGTGTLTMRIDKDTDIDENSEPSWPKDVIGIFNQYDNSSPFTDGYQLLPRSYADFVPDGSLPVELTSFTASVEGVSVTLNWETASELNNKGFEIQRTMNNEQLTMNNWEAIGFVEGRGTTTEINKYSFVDGSEKPSGSYYYRLKQIDNDGSYEYSSVVEVEVNNIPRKYSLSQNYPNPFNPSTKIEYSLPKKGFVTLKVYDILGNEVASLVNGEKEAGNYDATFDASQMTSGIYIYSIQVNNFRATRKMMLLK